MLGGRLWAPTSFGARTELSSLGLWRVRDVGSHRLEDHGRQEQGEPELMDTELILLKLKLIAEVNNAQSGGFELVRKLAGFLLWV